MKAFEVTIRAATAADAAACLAIYRPYIEHSAITFEAEVPAEDAFAARIEKCLRTYPWLVCIVDGAVAGYAYAAPYNERAAYGWAGLCSIYLADAFRGKGIARPLYEALFDLLRAQGFCSFFALITLPNDPSVRLHERLGFVPFTVFENIGYKLDAWQRVGWWRLDLADFPPNPPAPIPFAEFDRAEVGLVLAAATRKAEVALGRG
ncbi:MAG: N-acetyltransferase family protein [Chitinophagaceae bacterium]|nr:MAG: N-acetyltransferase family protein [Chitinophagaceae bacterium]